jgi:predicted enzyme related to lactoylglutathione lyase
MEVLNSHPVLAVHDLERSAAWYRDVLGCETRCPDPGNWTFCRSGAIDFMLGRSPDVMPASELGDHSYVAYLDVGDVKAFHDRAVKAGAEILKPPTDEPWIPEQGWSFQFGGSGAAQRTWSSMNLDSCPRSSTGALSR